MYDEKGYCVNLERRAEKGHDIHGPYTPYAYYCKLTEELCIADRIVVPKFNHRLSERLVERCPSRRTIQQVLNEQSEPNRLKVVEKN